jgi:hypothetical protein
MADSSRVGSRLEEVLAIFTAATPGATPRPEGVFAVWDWFALAVVLVVAPVDAVDALADLVDAGAGVGAGLEPP